MPSLVLIVLKYVGTGIAAATGILGTLTETRDKATGRLNRWGRWALTLTIGASIVALASQAVEQAQASRERQEAARERVAAARAAADEMATLEAELALADSAAKGAEGIRTRFTKLRVEAVVELPLSNPDVASLASDLDVMAQGVPNDDAWPAGIMRLRSFVIVTSRSQMNDPSIVALLERHRALVNLIEQQDLFVGIRRNPLGDVSESDWSPTTADLAAASTTRSGCTIFYRSQPRRLLVKLPSIESTSEDWTTTGKIVGVSDLSGAQVTVSLIIGRDSTLANVPMVECTLEFDRHACRLENLASARQKDWLHFSARLPSADAITTGTFDPYSFLSE